MSVIQKLLKQYPNARQINSLKDNEYDQYQWYRDASDELIAFPAAELSSKEAGLLELMLEPAAAPLYQHSNEWERYLFGDNTTCPLPEGTAFRLVLFSFGKAPVFPEEGHPLQFVFADDSTIVQRDELNGYVVELQTANTLSLEELSSASQALETDIDVSTYFFAGSFHEANQATKEQLLMEHAWYNQHKSYIQRQKVSTTQSIIPLLILDRFTDMEKQSQFSIINNAFDGDPELATVIRTLVENLSNVSSTAKLLYLHRNSLQYRLDKFSERTGIDLKSFHGSMTAYLASLQWDSDKKSRS
ncbi:helix-turn-helix domain-containing protein [Jeotgalibacillus sp. S-D1]|uniref:helix-turn-helix domain-containing protein n=1 Tax=Jeotgalibacillus sp. S-D1 TaxID=2552189 RepID=UPI001404F444|nr:helix-turn-helix domain-containing protein [Jeotgalibacillus sp. S-D1]